METCCKDIPDIACSIVGINERIFPITYTDNTLIIDSSMSVQDSLTIGGAQISVQDDHINLPAKTLINGVPLLSDAFDTISLPNNTILNGYQPVTEHFYYYFTALKGSRTLDGYIVNGYNHTVGKFTPNKQLVSYGFSFIAPEECMLTSLKVLCVLKTSAVAPTPAPTDISIVLDVMDTELTNIYYTGVTLEIPSPAANSRNFVETEFEYPLFKGDSAAVYIVGSTDTLGTISSFAILGYKMLPPPSVSASMPPPFYANLKSVNQDPSYNRFPFNHIMNTMAQIAVQSDDQRRMMRTPGTTKAQIYGRVLTKYDYDRRSLLLENVEQTETENDFANLFSKQDIIAFLFCGGKEMGSYVDFSYADHGDTLELDTKHNWKGILIGNETDNTKPQRQWLLHFIQTGEERVNYISIFSQHGMPSYMDYLSFDCREERWSQDTLRDFLSVLMDYQFGVIVVRHDNNILHRKMRKEIVSMNYIQLFSNVEITTDPAPILEDWYIHLGVLHPIVVQMMIEHRQNTSGITWKTCKNIITSVIGPDMIDHSLLQTKIFSHL